MRLSRCVGTVALVAGLVVSHASEALARGPAGSATPLPGPSELYVVVTSDGSRYEGELVENVVGDHITIRLASGEIRGFDVRDVRSMDLARPAMPPASMFTPFAGVLPGVPRTYEGPDAVPVHIMSTGAESARARAAGCLCARCRARRRSTRRQPTSCSRRSRFTSPRVVRSI